MSKHVFTDTMTLRKHTNINSYGPVKYVYSCNTSVYNIVHAYIFMYEYLKYAHLFPCLSLPRLPAYVWAWWIISLFSLSLLLPELFPFLHIEEPRNVICWWKTLVPNMYFDLIGMSCPFSWQTLSCSGMIIEHSFRAEGRCTGVSLCTSFVKSLHIGLVAF